MKHPPRNAPPIPPAEVMDLTAQDTIEKLLARKLRALEKLHREVAGLKNLINSSELLRNYDGRDLFNRYPPSKKD